MYIKENFIPFPDKKIQEKMTINLDKINNVRNNLLKIREKQEMNKYKGKEFLEESTKIGRKIKKNKRGTSTKENLKEEGLNDYIYSKDQFDNDNFSVRNDHASLYSKSIEKEKSPKKKRRKFKYRFKKKMKTEESEEEEESYMLEIGETEDFDDWEEEDLEVRTEKFLKKLKEKDRLINAEHGENAISRRFKTEEGRLYKNKVDFMVDTIRDKLNFIKKF